jgi:LysR family transcriptional regulator, low CO2-responsive transcriptional regulator
MTVTQLNAFLAVIRGGSVTAAAEQLVVTQPSVSSAIAALQKELGCELFERLGRGIRPTPAAITFAAYAEDIVGLLDAGRRAALEAAMVASRRLQIAAVTTAAESFVPIMMRAFSDLHPEIELTLVVGNHEDIIKRVLTHRDDVAISGRPPSNERLHAEPFLDNEIVCVTASDDPASSGAPADSATLRGRAWLLREQGSGTRTLNERFLSERDLTPKTLTLGSNGAIKQAARAGLGVSLLSRAAVAAELDAGVMGQIQLTDGPLKRQWFVLRSTIGPVNPTVDLFMQFACDAAPALLTELALTS